MTAVKEQDRDVGHERNRNFGGNHEKIEAIAKVFKNGIAALRSQ